MKKGELTALAAILAAAFFLRLAIALLPLGSNPDSLFDPDSHDYLRLATGIFELQSYGSMKTPEIARAPGYPLFLGAAMTSAKEIGARPLEFALFLQAALDAGTCLLLWLILRQVLKLGACASTTGLILQAFSAAALASCAKLLSESLFAFVFAASLYLLLPALLRSAAPQKEKAGLSWSLALSGALWGLACLTRVALIPATPLPALALCFFHRKAKPALAFLAPALILLGAWTLRNGLVADYWGVSSIASVNLYRYDACAIEASRSGRPFAEVQAKFDAKAPSNTTQKNYACFCKKEGAPYVLKNPLAFMEIHLKGIAIALLPADGDVFKSFGWQIGGNGTLSTIMSQGFVAGVRNYFNGHWSALALAAPSVALLLLKYLLVAAMALPFAWKAWREKPFALLLLASLAAWLLFAGGAAATPRFRVPVEPLLAIFAALSVSLLEPKLATGFFKNLNKAP